MNGMVRLHEQPTANEIYMIAGWEQWADAGAVSSELPEYLVQHLQAHPIGTLEAAGCYLFQIPGTHYLVRPKIKLEDGHRVELSQRRNEFFYAGNELKGLVIFRGQEPHQNIESYAAAFFDAVEALGVKRVITLGGVHGPMPYSRDRQIACVYSLPSMQQELTRYAVQFSGYEGGSSIGTYLAHVAEKRGIELLTFYAFVPFYDFEELAVQFIGVKIDHDFKAWYDLMRRINYMFGLEVDLSNLERKSRQLVAIVDSQIQELDEKMPHLQVRKQIQELDQEFEETTFAPLDDLWGRELKDLFDE